MVYKVSIETKSWVFVTFDSIEMLYVCWGFSFLHITARVVHHRGREFWISMRCCTVRYFDATGFGLIVKHWPSMWPMQAFQHRLFLGWELLRKSLQIGANSELVQKIITGTKALCMRLNLTWILYCRFWEPGFFHRGAFEIGLLPLLRVRQCPRNPWKEISDQLQSK